MPAQRLSFSRPSLLALTAAAVVLLATTKSPAQLGSDLLPSRGYFSALEQIYQGEYRDAERLIRNEVTGAIKIGVTGRWLDSITYHALWGEVLYHQGRSEAALAQFDRACNLFLQYPTWLLRVDFKQNPRADANRLRRQIPWGQSTRRFTLGNFPGQMLINQGELLSGNRAAQRGGVVQSAQLWQINVIEIVRSTALAIRRRNELLGPLSAQDDLTRKLAATRGGSAPPNHWSRAWVDLQRGLIYKGQGKNDQARKYLSQAERIAGQFDHPLTCVALLELGRIEMAEGNAQAAASLFNEASYSAFYYENPAVVDEAFKLATANRLARRPDSVNPALAPAATWARRERYDHIFARLNFALAEELMAVGNWSEAEKALQTGQSRLQDARNALLGNWSQYLAARILFHRQQDSAHDTLAQAIERAAAMSPKSFQIQLANRRFDSQEIPARTAVNVYQTLLDDPSHADWVFRPLDTLAHMKTPHGQAFDRWIAALVERKALGAALEVTDLSKRRRFHGPMPWGGKQAALRDALEASENSLSEHNRNVRNELLLRYPTYAQAALAGEDLHQQLKQNWQVGLDETAQRKLVKTWRDWSATIDSREAMLDDMSLERVAADLHFPPLVATTQLQSVLQPGQAVLSFHNTSQGLLGFLVTSDGASHWNCGPMTRLKKLTDDFLRKVGNYDANHDLTYEEMQSAEWVAAGDKLFHALVDGSSIDPSALEELVVVPDGLVWYVPFAALSVGTEEGLVPLISLTRIRVVPTVGLAFGHAQPWRRVQRSGIVGTELLPGDSEEEQSEVLGMLREVVPNTIEIPTPPPVPLPLVGSLLETLVVLDEVDISPARPLDWTPLPAQGRSAKNETLRRWLTLPQFGPQRIIIPAAHTIAERGGKTSKRRGAAAQPGSELFLATCGLMSSGAQTILISRWNVGGYSTIDLMREFAQELPHTSATAAWQRTVQVAAELPIDPEIEPRVKPGKDDPPLTAAHPFFWSGYLLVDAGEPVELKRAAPALSTAESSNSPE